MREAHHSCADGVGDLDGDLQAPAVGGDPGPSAVGETQPGRVLRVDVEGAAVGTSGEGRDVVQPAVVGPQVAAAHEHQGGGAVGERRAQRGELGRDGFREQLDPAAARPQHFREAGPQRAQVDAVRRLEQVLEAQLVRSETQHQVQPPLRAGAPRQPERLRGRVGAVQRRVLVGDGPGEGVVDDALVDGLRRGSVQP